MSERPRHRTVLGATTTVCPHCGGGPMVITRSQHTRRLRDLANPRFDPGVVHREVCTVCSTRFPVGGDRLRSVLEKAAGGAPAAGGPCLDAATAALQGNADAAEKPRAETETETETGTATGTGTEEEAREQAEVRESTEVATQEHATVDEPSRRAAAEAAEIAAAERTRAQAPERTPAPWGMADIAPRADAPAPTRSSMPGRVVAGEPTEVGAGRRSGPVRRRVGGRAG